MLDKSPAGRRTPRASTEEGKPGTHDQQEDAESALHDLRRKGRAGRRRDREARDQDERRNDHEPAPDPEEAGKHPAGVPAWPAVELGRVAKANPTAYRSGTRGILSNPTKTKEYRRGSMR